MKIWDIDSGTLIKSIEAHDDNVNSVAISTDDRYIASGGDDAAIKVWATWKD
ncbi:hypothetical protein [Mesotoga sp.]|uniref:WD40 repeat domain-containing protein n=1 Tax=Mesotoga sp. TaxID=2053577 RepID=UPI001BD483B1